MVSEPRILTAHLKHSQNNFQFAATNLVGMVILERMNSKLILRCKCEFLREIILSSEGAERNSLPPMTVPDPSPVLDKNHPPMSP